MSLIYETYEFNQNPDTNDMKLLFENLKLHNHSEMGKIINVFQRLNCDFTIISEFPYVDRNFRDSYYIYHSKKFFAHERDCIRLLIFKGKIDLNSYLPFSEESEIQLNSIFIGFIVIQPIYSGLIGTTVIDPSYLKDCCEYMCLGKFNCTMRGFY